MEEVRRLRGLLHDLAGHLLTPSDRKAGTANVLPDRAADLVEEVKAASTGVQKDWEQFQDMFKAMNAKLVDNIANIYGNKG